MAGKVFLLGVGCQKGATSWVSRYLRNHEAVDMGFAKEYHIFDALYVQSLREFRVRVEREATSILEGGTVDSDRAWSIFKKLEFFHRPESYIDYFDYLAMRNHEVRLVGDITPSYAALPESAFRWLREGLTARGFTVRVLFIMRDPVDRVCSSVRFGRKRSKHASKKSLSEEVNERYSTKAQRLRTEYQHTIRNLESVFSSEELHFAFYESLFSATSIMQVMRFLDLTYYEPDFEVRVNASQEDEVVPDVILKDVANYYTDTYMFVAQRYGAEAVRRLWPSYSMLE